MDPRQPASSSDTLHGWKEIAVYIGKSVRAAQRWEHDLGLPVRRLKTLHSQVIFASRQEIDEWRRQLEVQPGAGESAGKRPHVAQRVEPMLAPSRGLARLGWLWAAIATLGVLALIIWFW